MGWVGVSGAGFEVDPAVLEGAARGIEAVIGGLNEVGIGFSGEAGRGFSQVVPSRLAVGHAGLHGALAEFGSRWEWGVRGLVRDGHEYARQLGLSAGAYHHMDEYAGGVLRGFVGAATTPGRSSEEFEDASWDEIKAGWEPDHSAESWERTGEEAERVWSAVGRDVSDGSWVTQRLEEASGYHEELERARDVMFGPADAPGQGTR